MHPWQSCFDILEFQHFTCCHSKSPNVYWKTNKRAIPKKTPLRTIPSCLAFLRLFPGPLIVRQTTNQCCFCPCHKPQMDHRPARKCRFSFWFPLKLSQNKGTRANLRKAQPHTQKWGIFGQKAIESDQKSRTTEAHSSLLREAPGVDVEVPAQDTGIV